MAQDTPSRKLDQYIVRFPEGMRDEIREQARKSGRSMNAEIIHRLSNSLSGHRFEDDALGLGEDLDFKLMSAATYNNRSLKDELIYRVEQSLTPQTNLIIELENTAHESRRKYDEIMKSYLQLTPEERSLLEERVEIVDLAKKKLITSKQIGAFVRLNPIGNRGRVVLTAPKSDYSPLENNEA